MIYKALTELPVAAVLPAIGAALEENRPVVLHAPPGTGKTLLVAPSLLDSCWLVGQRIILLEPRRIAARAAARRMAHLLGEEVGERVGYQVRLERRVGPRCRIEVLTEGLLVQRLLSDPGLEGVGAVIFDEFHERNLSSDFALALTMDMRRMLRPDLRLVAMSATLDGSALLGHLGADSREIRVEERSWPVETRYLERVGGREGVARQMASAVRLALTETQGGILAFLPGEGEIRRTEDMLRETGLRDDVDLLPLYGALTRSEQERALEPAMSGRRKVVLATSIAESSLTIDGIRVVVDSGWMRVPRFSPRYGMGKLETLRITRDRADQRRGRAGRTEAGVCYRLWDLSTNQQLQEQSTPEILDADLATLRLQCADWGCSGREDLPWLSMPPFAAWTQATELLERLGLIDAEGRLTGLGRRVARLPLHPRLGLMIEKAAETGCVRQALRLAAVIEEGSSIPGEYRRVDLDEYLMNLESGRSYSGVREWGSRVERLVKRWGRGYADTDSVKVATGRLLAWAYPEWVAQQRGAHGHYRLANGHGVVLDEVEPLAAERWLAVGEIQGVGGVSRIRMAAALELGDIVQDFGELLEVENEVEWDRRELRVRVSQRERLGSLVLREALGGESDTEAVTAVLIEGILGQGIANLGWNKDSRALQERIMFLHRSLAEEGWPDVSDNSLAGCLEEWLGDWLAGLTRWDHVRRVDLREPLLNLLGAKRGELDILAPTHWVLPSGRRARLDYGAGDQPVLSAQLQDMFGMRQLPRLARGRVGVVAHLLSPARRPVAVTSDLESFWRNGYKLVRKEYRGRYPKHAWPEDPP